MDTSGLIYLKDRDQIVASLPEKFRCDAKRIQDELDFYPDTLKPYMGITIEGFPGAWRYKGDAGHIFDVHLSLSSLQTKRPDGKLEVFTLKDTWFECLNPKHKQEMQAKIAGQITSEPVCDAQSPVHDDEVYAGIEEDEDEDEDYMDEPEDGTFNESPVLYLKTPAEMGISADAFAEGRFVASQYYPQDLKAHVGKVLSADVTKFYVVGEGEDSVPVQKNLIFIYTDQRQTDSAIRIEIPVNTEEIDREHPDTLMFDYKNWISLFATIVEANGPNMAELVSVARHMESIGISPEQKPAETEKPTCSPTACACGVKKDKSESGIYLLASYKTIGVTEAEFWAKNFPGSKEYPDKLMEKAGSAVSAQVLDNKTALVEIDKVPFVIGSEFLVPVDKTVLPKEEREYGDVFNSLEDFMEIVEEDEFRFIDHPSLTARLEAVSDGKANLTDLISMLSKDFVLKKHSSYIDDIGEFSDFIVVAGFKPGVKDVTVPLYALPLLLIHDKGQFVKGSEDLVEVIDIDGLVSSIPSGEIFDADSPEMDCIDSMQHMPGVFSGEAMLNVILYRYEKAVFIRFKNLKE